MYQQRPSFAFGGSPSFGGFGSSAASASAAAQSFGLSAFPGIPGPPPSRPIYLESPVSFENDVYENRLTVEHIQNEPIEIVTRKEFPETWIFDDFEIME